MQLQGKWPWALKNNLQFGPKWALVWDTNCLEADILTPWNPGAWVLAQLYAGHYGN